MSLEFVARHGIISLGNVQVTGSITASGGINISGSIASASFAESSSYATTASYALTASSVLPLVQNVQITGSTSIQNTTGNSTDNVLVVRNSTTTGNPYVNATLALDGAIPGEAVDIRFASSNPAALRIYADDNVLTSSPEGAGFQLFNNSSPNFPGQVYFDAGANDNGGLIFRAATTSGTITTAMKINSSRQVLIADDSGNLGSPSTERLNINGNVVANTFIGALSGNASTATSASHALNADNAITASFALTAASATNFTASNILVTGNITAQTLDVQQITSSVIYSSGSNIFGNSLSNTQQLTGSVTITGSLSLNNIPVVTANQTSSMTVLSASFATSASNSISGSYALTASYALNAGGGGVSAIYIADEGTLQGTASYFDFTGAGVTATVSAGTASINISGGGGGGTAGLSTTFTQSVAADPWTFTHNLNTRTPLIQVYDTSFNQITPQFISASNAQTVIITFGVPTAGYAVGSTGGTLVVTGSNVILNQSVAATTWSFNHNLNTQYPVFQVFNSANEVVIPERIVASTPTSSVIYFPTALSGYAVASVGGLSGSISASYAISASQADNTISSSYALTASFALNGGGSGTTAVANQGTFIGTASYFDYVGNNISASVVNNTASITIIGATGTSALTQSIAAATWSFTHNLNTYTPLIQVYDSSYNQIIPNVIVGTTPNVAQIRFDYSQSGFAVASNGGTLTVSGSTAQLNQTVAATTWSFAHNLNSQYVNFEVYDSNNFVIIPANIQAVDRNNASLTFATPTSGTAIAMFSGISGAPNATTASFALTASYLNPVTNGYVVLTQVSQSLNFTDDVTAAAGGVPLGGLYRNGNFIAIRIS